MIAVMRIWRWFQTQIIAAKTVMITAGATGGRIGVFLLAKKR